MEKRADSGKKRVKKKITYDTRTENMKKGLKRIENVMRPEMRYPFSVINYLRERKLHKQQKALKVCEYLIKTYSLEGDLILDNCSGSGTIPLAAKRLGRDFIGIEIDKQHYINSWNRVNSILF